MSGKLQGQFSRNTKCGRILGEITKTGSQYCHPFFLLLQLNNSPKSLEKGQSQMIVLLVTDL